MSEEKQAIEKLKSYINVFQEVLDEEEWYSFEEIESAKEYQETTIKILNIIEKQQKENELLKAMINKEHEMNLDKRYVEIKFISKDKIKNIENKFIDKMHIMDMSNIHDVYREGKIEGKIELYEELLGGEDES